MKRLATEENYLVQTMKKSLAKNGINLPEEEIAYQLTEDFIVQEANFYLVADVSTYDFVLELLYDLAQLEYTQKSLQKSKTELARELFLECRISEALPMLEELVEEGDIQARYILARIYGEGINVTKDWSYASSLLKENISADDVCSIFLGVWLDIVEEDYAKNYLDTLTNLADNGNVFAQYELARCCECCSGVLEEPKEEIIYSVKYYTMACEQNFLPAFVHLAGAYFYGIGIEENKEKAIELLKKACEKGLYSIDGSDVSQEIGNYYSLSNDYEQAIEWYKRTYPMNVACLKAVAYCYHCLKDYDEERKWIKLYTEGVGYEDLIRDVCWAKWHASEVALIEYLKRAVELEEMAPYTSSVKAEYYLIQELIQEGYKEYHIAKIYEIGGHGITANRSLAREWYKKAADKGYGYAKKWLRGNPY